LRYLLDEQGDAVGALDDILPDALRQHLVADEVVDHRADFTLRQSIDGEGSHVRPSDPGRIEFRPGGVALRRGRYREIAAHCRAAGKPRHRVACALALFLLAAAHGQCVLSDHGPDGTRRRTGARRHTSGLHPTLPLASVEATIRILHPARRGWSGRSRAAPR